MTAQPQWADSGQGDLLALIAMGSPATGSAEEEWDLFVHRLREVALGYIPADGTISPNVLRRLVRDQVAPRRIGAFTNRALSRGLIAPTGEWEISDDTQGHNAGRPMRVYRWTGGEL